VTIGVLHLDFRIPGARSLKDKRRVMQSLKQVMRNRYNCSVAEVEFKDTWGRARLAVCVVSDESRHANQQLNEIARFAGSKRGAELTDYWIEML
jgi:uncharacterized protein YlxP (DUF503 family)